METFKNRISVAILSFFPKFTGTTITINYYYKALTDMGFRVKWYQLISDDNIDAYPNSDEFIKGINALPSSLRIPLDVVFVLPSKVMEMEEDILLITDQVASNLCQHHNNSITIVHDLRDLTKFNRSNLRKLYFTYVLRFLRNSSLIIAVSDYTREQLSEKLHIKNNVAVVPNCFPERKLFIRSKELADIGNLGKTDINVLYVTADRPYKNINLFLQIAKSINKRDLPRHYNFILVSRLKSGTMRKVKKMRLPNLQVLQDLPDINPLYEKTDILLFTSLIEGFGLPIIEAMSYGIPVIHAKLRPMTDVVENGGISVDPDDTDAWIKALMIISEPETYREKSVAALNRAKNFEYEKFESKLKEVMKVYLEKRSFSFPVSKE